jgi:hypothetical protein
MSADLHGGQSARKGDAAKALLRAFNPLAQWTDYATLAADPDSHAQLSESCRLGGSKDYRGCHLGCAVLYNCQTFGHRDKKDMPLCFTICHGKFTGGHMVFAQLGLVFRFVGLHFSVILN